MIIDHKKITERVYQNYEQHFMTALKVFNLYIEREVLEKLEVYCEETGLTKTKAIERILNSYLKSYFK